MSGVELVWDSRCVTAESCVWNAIARRILYADIEGQRILAYGVDDGSRAAWDFPEPVGSFGLCRSGRFVVALRHRVVLFDPRSGKTVALTDEVDEPPTNRLNDGKVGPDGCFWVGSMDTRPLKEPTGSLYRVRPDGKIERRESAITISNGLAWSPDGRTLYHADSVPCTVNAWTFDAASGAASDRRLFAKLSVEEGKPDGAACDAEGCYWSAGVSAGCLNRLSPAGALVDKVALPVPAPTMPCFADEWLYFTTLRRRNDPELLRKYPTLGGLFRLPAPVAGAPVGVFGDD